MILFATNSHELHESPHRFNKKFSHELISRNRDFAELHETKLGKFSFREISQNLTLSDSERKFWHIVVSSNS
jgi:hypothetical protein